MLPHSRRCAGTWGFPCSAQLLLRPQGAAVPRDSCGFLFFVSACSSGRAQSLSVSDTPPLPRFHLFASWAPACLIPQPCARLLITQTWGFLALVITHCGKPATFFSEGTAVAGTGTDTSSSNQQSRDRAVLISFDSLFASGGGTPSEKPTDPGRAGAPAGRHPRLICTPN